jgi:hypothetical protein
MIQVVTFTGASDEAFEAASKAATTANQFFYEHKIDKSEIVGQSTSTSAVVIDALPWVHYTLTMILDLPYSLEESHDPYPAM